MKRYYSAISLLFLLFFSGFAFADVDVDCIQRYEQLVAEGVQPVEALEQVIQKDCGGDQATQVAAMALLAVSDDPEGRQRVLDIAAANGMDKEKLLETYAALVGDSGGTGGGGPRRDSGSTVPASSGGGGMPPGDSPS